MNMTAFAIIMLCVGQVLLALGIVFCARAIRANALAINALAQVIYNQPKDEHE